jgi:WD40 repeat protein
LKIWEVATGRVVFSRARTDDSRHVTMSPDGKTVLAWETDERERLMLYDVATGAGRVIGKELGAYAFPYLAPDGQRLIVYGRCCNVRQDRLEWKVRTAGSDAVFAPNGRAVFMRADEDKDRWFATDLATGKPASDLRLPKKAVQGWPIIAPDNRTLIFASGDEVMLWDMRDGRELRRLPIPKELFSRIFESSSPFQEKFKPSGPFSPDGKSLLTNLGTVQRWELTSCQPMLPDTTELGHTDTPSVLVFSPNGKWLVSSGDTGDRTICIWDVATARLLRTLPALPSHANTLVFAADSKKLFSCAWDGSARIWDIDSGRELHVCRMPLKEHAIDLKISSDGRRLMALSIPDRESGDVSHCHLSTWDTASGEQLGVRKCTFQTAVSWLTLTHNGGLLCDDGKLLNVDGGKAMNPAPRLEGEETIRGVAATPDRRLAASTMSTGNNRYETEIVVWEFASGSLSSHG